MDQNDNELKNKLEAVQKELTVTERRLHQMTLEKQRLEQSFDWKVFQGFRRTVNRLLPQGSLRFKLAQQLLAIPIALKKHGLGAALHESRSFLAVLGGCFLRLFSFRKRAMKLTPPDISEKPLKAHNEGVDIVICVHNAPEDVRRCITSLIAHTLPPYHIILVDDGSAAETAAYLRDIAENQGAELIRNDQAKGYTLAANQGMRASQNSLVVLLNSDTIVSSGWLDRLIRCAATSPKICAAGPLSNTASWQSVPELFLDNGDWHDNPLPPGYSVEDVGRILATAASPVYPRIPFLNGFCMLIKKRALKSIGLFDEETFGAGYGEENDFALRAAAKGWQMAIADDAYVFHAQSKSYSHERRLELARRSDEKLVAKHGTSRKDAGLLVCQHDRVLTGMRARAAVMFERDKLLKNGLERFEAKRVLFLLPIMGAGGGGHVIVQEAAAMRRMGVDASIVNLELHREIFEREYPDIGVPVIYVHDAETDIDYRDFDAVIATHYMSVTWMHTITAAVPEIIPGYYVQDYEPFFYQPKSLEYMTARKSYKVPDRTRVFVKTGWVRDTLLKEENLESCLIGPGVESSLFRPRPPSREIMPATLNILAMVRPITPRRAPQLTMRVLKRIAEKYGKRVSLHIFGCSGADPDFMALERGFAFTNHGSLDRLQTAALMNQMDIFADFSTFQAMGLTALEAMASGAAVIVPQNGGATEYAVHEENALVIDSSDEEQCFQALCRLVDDRKLALNLQQAGAYAACRFYPEKAAFNILSSLFETESLCD